MHDRRSTRRSTAARLRRRVSTIRTLRPRWSRAPSEPRGTIDARSPTIPSGWTLGPPDFIGIGAQWAGTSWWWSLLSAHPDMVGTVQETRVFADFGWRPLFARDIAAYHRWFPRREGSVTGEWSSDYMSMPAALDHIRACAPEARFLALLSDPVERYRAGVDEWRRAKERRGRRLNLWAGQKEAYRRSFYGFALRQYVEAFGRDRLLVLQLERCQADPAEEFRRTLAFLGLREWSPPKDILSAAPGRSRERRTATADDEPDDLVRMLEPDVQMLQSLIPDLDLTIWPNFRHLAGAPH